MNATDYVMLHVYEAKHREWLERNPEFTQSPYTALLLELLGQLRLFDDTEE